MNSSTAKSDDFPHAGPVFAQPVSVKPASRMVDQLTARHPYRMEAAYRSGRRRSAGAVVVAIVLHLAALYYLTSATVPVELTSARGGSAQTISVSLVAAAPAPPVTATPRPVTPEVLKPIAPSVRKPIKSTPVLATHHESSRTVSQPDETKPQPEPQNAPPPVQQTQPEPAATASPAASSLPSASDNSKMMVLPKAIDSSALHQLQCRIPAPLYPPRAKRLGEAGTVKVQFTIGTNGRFSDARVVSSSSYADLDGAAIQAISAGTCQPYLHDGTAIAVTAVQPVSFNLGD
ncbi:energy transducer TonB [Paraburkholderia megapolitana]|uniref:energy transducer TonB n=1 Tax=Paraburkholderia megapolitana TaxID=420953 RepID=UPI0038B9DD54